MVRHNILTYNFLKIRKRNVRVIPLLSRRVTHKCVLEVLIRTCSTEETFFQDFLVILKQMLQN